jgi:hypothetical protein
MADDYSVKPRSAKDIAAIALAWRDALGVADTWSPNVIELLEIEVPKLIPEFALVVRPDDQMADAEAYMPGAAVPFSCSLQAACQEKPNPSAPAFVAGGDAHAGHDEKSHARRARFGSRASRQPCL